MVLQALLDLILAFHFVLTQISALQAEVCHPVMHIDDS